MFYNERCLLRAAGTADGTEQGGKTPALWPQPSLHALVRKAVLNGFTEVAALFRYPSSPDCRRDHFY
ncbi:hypothetical protein BN131_80 [Cronobacter malonaticus 681]|nr:hypothetical protein BN131_80 [Cronobacter malonaticus 681]